MCSSVLCLFFNKKIGFLLQKASKLIVKRSSPMDGQLFLIKHLLILREQVISPLSLSLSIFPGGYSIIEVITNKFCWP